jgi:hypothetical protein
MGYFEAEVDVEAQVAPHELLARYASNTSNNQTRSSFALLENDLGRALPPADTSDVKTSQRVPRRAGLHTVSQSQTFPIFFCSERWSHICRFLLSELTDAELQHRHLTTRLIERLQAL